jgi:hypothetical protein
MFFSIQFSASLGVILTSGALIYIQLFRSEVDAWFREGNIETIVANKTNNTAQIQEQLQIFINFKKLWMDDGGVLASALLILGILYTLQKLVLASLLIIGIYQVKEK